MIWKFDSVGADPQYSTNFGEIPINVEEFKKS